MDKELRDKWVTALRSGDYKQGRDSLRSGAPDSSRYCCLGVLCDLIPTVEWDWNGDDWNAVDKAVTPSDEFTRELEAPERNDVYLPHTLKGTMFSNDIEFELATKNDEGHTFEDIADIIVARVPVENL